MSKSNNIRGRDKYQKFKWFVDILIIIVSLLPKKVRKYFFQLFRNTKGVLGLGIRYVLIKTIALEVGDNVSIHPGVYLLEVEKLELGDNISIHPMCYIDATGGISIGDDVSIAHSASIMSSTHNYERQTIPIKDQGIKLGKTIIENDVWIGAKATILFGTTIKHGSIIGASSVVTKDVPPNTIIVGIPGKAIKTR